MRYYSKGVVSLFLLSLLAIPAMQAQEQDQQYGPNGEYRRDDRDSRQRPSAPQSLSSDERLAILGTALDFRHRTKTAYDCSHFIHALYERAGFPYEYASSSDLYSGIDEFQRVSHPQPGDLIVWRGHAGIVTSATQRTFFSLLSSGPAVNHYDSRYWKRRGVPRFFRYVKTNSDDFLSSSFRTSPR
jgi:cell wall-associated NlpC family hydrolase